MTAYLASQKHWGLVEAHRPAILFRWKEIGHRDPDDQPTDWICPWTGLPVHNPRTGHNFKDWRDLPRQLSSQVEGWLLEAICRTDSRILMSDIMVRIRPECRGRLKSANTLQMRKKRFRELYRLRPWGIRAGSDYWCEVVDNALTDEQKAQNTTRGLRPLTLQQHKELLNQRKGTAPNRARDPRALGNRTDSDDEVQTSRNNRSKKRKADDYDDDGASDWGYDFDKDSKSRDKGKKKRKANDDDDDDDNDSDWGYDFDKDSKSRNTGTKQQRTVQSTERASWPVEQGATPFSPGVGPLNRRGPLPTRNTRSTTQGFTSIALSSRVPGPSTRIGRATTRYAQSSTESPLPAIQGDSPVSYSPGPSNAGKGERKTDADHQTEGSESNSDSAELEPRVVKKLRGGDSTAEQTTTPISADPTPFSHPHPAQAGEQGQAEEESSLSDGPPPDTTDWFEPQLDPTQYPEVGQDNVQAQAYDSHGNSLQPGHVADTFRGPSLSNTLEAPATIDPGRLLVGYRGLRSPGGTIHAPFAAVDMIEPSLALLDHNMARSMADMPNLGQLSLPGPPVADVTGLTLPTLQTNFEGLDRFQRGLPLTWPPTTPAMQESENRALTEADYPHGTGLLAAGESPYSPGPSPNDFAESEHQEEELVDEENQEEDGQQVESLEEMQPGPPADDMSWWNDNIRYPSLSISDSVPEDN